MKPIKFIKKFLPLLISFFLVVSFTVSTSTKKYQTTEVPSVVVEIAIIEDSTEIDIADLEEFLILYNELSSIYDLSPEFVEAYYPAVAAAVRLTVAAGRYVVAATRALTRNTAVMQQLTPTLANVIGNVVRNLLFFARNTNGIEKRILENNLEQFKIYCLG